MKNLSVLPTDYSVPQKVLSHLGTNTDQQLRATIQDKSNTVLNIITTPFSGYIPSGYGAGLTFDDSNALTV